MKVTSDISWLLNIAAFRSLTVGLLACQLGSNVAAPGGGAGDTVGEGAELVDPQGDGGPL
jgi:hypothetical protein